MKYLNMDFVNDNLTIYDKKSNKRYDYDGSKDIGVAIIIAVSLTIIVVIGICILKIM